MFRVSDRLPSRRRRSSGGRHVAPRPEPTATRAPLLTRVPTRVAQGGVALGLVLSMGAVVVTANADEAPAEVAAAAVDPLLPATDTVDRAALERTAQLRAEAVEAARVVVDEAAQVRADADGVEVPDDALAELDAATAQLQAAMAHVEIASLGDGTEVDRSGNVSRNAERQAAEPTQGPTAEPSEPAASSDADATPAPASTATPSASADATPAGDDATPGDDASAEPQPRSSTTPDAGTLAAGTAGAATDGTLPDSADPATTPLRAALDRVKQAAEVVRTSTEQKRAEAAAAQAAAEEAARVEAEKQAQRAAWKASLQGFANGEIPASALCGVSFDANAKLRCDAAEALDALDAAFFARFGVHLTVSDSYRSYGAQVACRANKGSLCAAPGTSNHGMGVAVDLGGAVQSFGTAQHQWMRENAPAYQWVLPEWARASGSKPEPWHWEYVG